MKKQTIIEKLDSELITNDILRKEYRKKAEALCSCALPKYPNSQDLLELSNAISEIAYELSVLEAKDELILKLIKLESK